MMISEGGYSAGAKQKVSATRTLLALLLDRFNRPMQHWKQPNVRHAVGFPIHVAAQLVPPAVRLFENTGTNDSLYSKRVSHVSS